MCSAYNEVLSWAVSTLLKLDGSTIEELINDGKKVWIDNKALEVRGWSGATEYVARHCNVLATARKAGTMPS